MAKHVASFPPVENSKRFNFTLDEATWINFKEHTRQFVPIATAADAQRCMKFFATLERHRTP